MWIIVGLGNPGIAYRKSRHNAGFNAIDVLADRWRIRVAKRGLSGIYGEGFVGGERVVLVKPQTYMNLSGDCVQRVMHFFKVQEKNLIVLYDDIDLPVGSLRIRANGSAGTHNGMRSVIACVGSENVPRVRIGVGGHGDAALRDYVLGKPGQEEFRLLTDAFARAAEAAELILAGDIAKAQMQFNKKHEGR